MNKIELTAPCGLDCFNCGTYEHIRFVVGKGPVLEN